MKSNKLVIKINKSVKEVFEFVIDPANTPKWIDFIMQEKANEWPPKLGTIYKNKSKDGQWRDLEMTEFEQDRMFVMTSWASGYNVRYTLNPVSTNVTELEYYEWMGKGELSELFTMKPLQKLKSIIEEKE